MIVPTRLCMLDLGQFLPPSLPLADTGFPVFSHVLLVGGCVKLKPVEKVQCTLGWDVNPELQLHGTSTYIIIHTVSNASQSKARKQILLK